MLRFEGASLKRALRLRGRFALGGRFAFEGASLDVICR